MIELDFYTGLLLWLGGFFGGFTVFCLLMIAGLKRGWIRIRE